MNVDTDTLMRVRREILVCRDFEKLLVLPARQEISKEPSRAVHFHNFFELRLLFESADDHGRHFENLQEICLTPAGVVHLTLLPEELRRHITIQLDVRDLYYVYGRQFVYTQHLPCHQESEGIASAEILSEIIRCTRMEKIEFDYLRILIALLISNVLHVVLSHDRLEMQPPAAVIAAYIRDHYYRSDLSIREIAEATHYSPNYIQKVFRLGWNCTPVEYLNRIRLSQAQVLLRQHRYQIKEVAFMCGWNYTHYFCRKYREYFGYSPSKEL